jgi:putative tryptophan/tyrosine transport system substrate-binding protein
MKRRAKESSCPGLSRASTSDFLDAAKTWMAGLSPAKTERLTRTEIHRREFMTLLGGAAAAWPLAARAQQPDRMRRIGVLMAYAEGDPEAQARIGAVQQGLRELGWTEGRNLRMEIRWGTGDPDRARSSATELISLEPDVIVAHGTPALGALHRATRTIPVVFVSVIDPVGAGYVQSLALPGGNITGFSTFEPEIGGKWLELLKEIAPGLSRVAGILDPGFKGFAGVWGAIENMAPRFGLKVTNLHFQAPTDDFESAVETFAQEPRGGLIVIPTALNAVQRNRIIASAARSSLPAMYAFRFYATDGGLMSYGIDTVDLFRRSASYVNRILKGEKPADLPVQAPTKFEMVINLKTAKALGLGIPPTIIARADEVIE